MSSGIYRREPCFDEDTEGWWDIINTETEEESGSPAAVIAKAETETMALHIQLIPEMKAALTEALTELDEGNAETPENSRYSHLWAVLKNLKVLE